MAKHTPLLLALFIVFMVSCQKEPVQSSITSLKDLKADANFSWNTHKNVTLKIAHPPKGILLVTNIAQNTRLATVNCKGNEDYITLPLNIPAYTSAVVVNGTKITLKESITDVNLAQLKHSESNYSMAFNGTDQWIKVPSSNYTFTNQVTFVAWVKADVNKTAKILQKGDWDGSGLGQDLWEGWQASFAMNDGTSTDLHISQRPTLNTWYHLASTYDGTSAKLYINGQLVKTINVGKTLRSNGRDISIAADNGNQKFFQGKLDELGIYGLALSQQQIQQLMGLGAPLMTNNLIAYYNLNEGSGTTAYEQSLNHYNGQIIGATYNTDVSYAAILDDDNDGVANSWDDYPLDASRAFDTYWPSADWYSLAFEDLWPAQGDYDLNDLVVDYRFKVVTNASNQVVEMFPKFAIRAIGGGHHNGFGFQLEPAIATDQISVSGTILTSNYITLNASGLESGQNKPTFIAFDDAWDLVTPVSGYFGFNVSPNAPYSTPDTVQLQINFQNPVVSISALNLASFNPFIIVNGIRGREVHLANHAPTSKADASLFGTQADNSIPQQNRYYKTSNNLPWAINVATTFEYPVEKCDIIQAHLKMADWAISGGTTFQDWYLNLTGYRNQSNIFQP